MRTLASALRRRSVQIGFWLFALPALFAGTLEVLVPLRMDDLGASGAAIGAVFLVAAAGEAVLSPWSGRLSDRHGRLAPIRVGLAGAVVMAVLLPLPGTVVLVALAWWPPSPRWARSGPRPWRSSRTRRKRRASIRRSPSGWPTWRGRWGTCWAAAAERRWPMSTADALPYALLGVTCAVTLVAVSPPTAGSARPRPRPRAQVGQGSVPLRRYSFSARRSWVASEAVGGVAGAAQPAPGGAGELELAAVAAAGGHRGGVAARLALRDAAQHPGQPYARALVGRRDVAGLGAAASAARALHGRRAERAQSERLAGQRSHDAVHGQTVAALEALHRRQRDPAEHAVHRGYVKRALKLLDRPAAVVLLEDNRARARGHGRIRQRGTGRAQQGQQHQGARAQGAAGADSYSQDVTSLPFPRLRGELTGSRWKVRYTACVRRFAPAT